MRAATMTRAPAAGGWLGRLCWAGVLSLALGGCAKQASLQVGLNHSDANEIVSLLTRYGIDASKTSSKEGVAVSVKADDIARATAAMQAAGLPRRGMSDLGTIFKKEGMISSPLEERVRYLHGLSEELGFTVQQFDRVIAARVHVVLPERIAPGQPIQPSSAAVFVKFKPPVDEDTLVPRIRNLVMASIPGLAGGSDGAPSKISVVLEPSDAAEPAIEWADVGPFRVQADSARGLTVTLSVLGVAVLLLLGALLAPSIKARLPARFKGALTRRRSAPATLEQSL
jgi:type III secretion protein J